MKGVFPTASFTAQPSILPASYLMIPLEDRGTSSTMITIPVTVRGLSTLGLCLCFLHMDHNFSLFCLHSHNERRNTFLHPVTGQVPEENKKFDLKT